jgi:hypothetical protein
MAGEIPPPPPGFTLDTQAAPSPPPGFTLDAPQAQQQAPPKPGWRDILAMAMSSTPEGAQFETALNAGTGMLATPVAGLAGIAQGAKNFFNPGMDAGDRVSRVQSALTYEPASAGGKELTEAVQAPFALLAKGADKAGSYVAEKTGSPAIGTAVNTGINMAPALLFRGKPSPKAAPVNPAITAENYVRSIGADWSRLSDPTRARITQIAQDAEALGKLDPAAVKRQIDLEALNIPATKGQLTRDPVQLRNEANVAATEGGKGIRQIHVAQNKALLDNLEILKGRVGAKAVTKEQVGESVQGAARAKLQASKDNVSNLYKQAEAAGELQAPVSVRSITKTIAESPDKTHYGWVQQWLKETGAEQKVGNNTALKKYSLKELEDLRQAAVARAMNGGTEGYYAGKIIRAIDQATDSAGGQAYGKARAARKAQAMEFEEQGGVARLVNDKSRTDRATALEDTWRKTVLGGSIDDLRSVKKTLLTGPGGKQAWKDIRGQTIQHIYDEATKSVTRFEDGSPNVTPASMDRAIKSVGPDKLNEIFGTGTVERLNKIMEATRIVKTEPPPSFKGSPTFANAIAFLEGKIGRIPVIGDVAAGTIKGAAMLKDIGKASKETRIANEKPLDVKTKNAMAASRSRNALVQGRGAAFATQQEK